MQSSANQPQSARLHWIAQVSAPTITVPIRLRVLGLSSRKQRPIVIELIDAVIRHVGWAGVAAGPWR